MTHTPIFQEKAEILCNREVGPDLYWIDLFSPDIARSARPGHFVHLVVSQTDQDHRPAWLRHTPLLRRPFSIAERDEIQGVFGLLYRVVGGGTEVLAERQPGDRLEILGPLGQPFEPLRSGQPSVMVAGGVGVAPFFFLATEAVRAGTVNADEITVLFGAGTAGLLSGEEKFRSLGVPTLLATDDGSQGYHGYVTTVLEDLLRGNPDSCRFLYACGPTPMMRRIQTIARQAGVPGQVSLEGIMPCGVGVCMACVVPCRTAGVPDGATRYERVCDTGPVFDIHEVVL